MVPLLEKASHAFCTDPVVVQREMVANCTGRNLIFQFRWTTPAAEDLQTVYTKCMPGNVLDLRDLTAKHKLATALGVTASTEQFTPAGGLLLEMKPGKRSWEIVAGVANKVSWWMEAPPPPIGIRDQGVK